MENNTKKPGEIKTWNKGKPNIVGGSGALGLIGGVAGKAVKMLNFAEFWNNLGLIWAKLKLSQKIYLQYVH